MRGEFDTLVALGCDDVEWCDKVRLQETRCVVFVRACARVCMSMHVECVLGCVVRGRESRFLDL